MFAEGNVSLKKSTIVCLSLFGWEMEEDEDEKRRRMRRRMAMMDGVDSRSKVEEDRRQRQINVMR